MENAKQTKRIALLYYHINCPNECVCIYIYLYIRCVVYEIVVIDSDIYI